MDYSQNYFQATFLVDRIRKAAAEGNKTKLYSGLGARMQENEKKLEDFDTIKAHYMQSVQDMFAPLREEKPEDSIGLGLGEDSMEAPRRNPKLFAEAVKGGNLSERDLLALTLQAEAGGEGAVGMLAAGAVIDNRAKSGKYGSSVSDVILAPGQFSAWNSATGYAGGEGGIDMTKVKASKTAYAVADQILSGEYESPVGGATHYYNPDVATPKWGKEAGGDWLTVGNHVFGYGN